VRLLTGGATAVVLPHLQDKYRLEPDLIFTGLRVIAGEAD
jgi:pantothenate kinase type III